MPNSTAHFDDRLFDLLPHRPPMLLINNIIDVQKTSSHAEVIIAKDSAFFKTDSGVPACIGLEYMGQTAALIAGYEKLQNADAEIRLGFLLGSRKYECEIPYFKEGDILSIECQEGALVGESLANFNCTIKYQKSDEILARANLSVLRKSIKSPE